MRERGASPGGSPALLQLPFSEYFRAEAFAAASERTRSLVECGSRVLATMWEPVLASVSPFSGGTQAFRFLWQPSSGTAFCVRVERCWSGSVVIFTQTARTARLRMDNLSLRRSRHLLREGWDEVLRQIERSSFWSLSTLGDEDSLDRAGWILEGRDRERYHVVARWGGGEIRDVCLCLLELSGEHPGEVT